MTTPSYNPISGARDNPGSTSGPIDNTTSGDTVAGRMTQVEEGDYRDYRAEPQHRH